MGNSAYKSKRIVAVIVMLATARFRRVAGVKRGAVDMVELRESGTLAFVRATTCDVGTH